MRAMPRSSYKWWALSTVSIGVFMSVLDTSLVNVSLPSIGAYFRVNLATVQWVLVAYLLTICALVLPLGRAADVLGRKRIYTAGFALFVAGSALSGLAQNMSWLVVARVLQAFGAASTMANGMAITTSVFPPEERGKALGINATVVALAATSGPIVGGVLVDTLGWRSVFFVNLPTGLLGVGMALAILKEELISTKRDASAQRFDWPGAVLSALGLVTFLLALSEGGRLGWLSPLVLTLFPVAALSFASFAFIELRVREPMIDLGLFRRRLFALGTSAGFLSFVANSINAFLIQFYLQGVRGYPARTAGLMVIPLAAALAVAGPLGGRISDRIGARIPSSLGLMVVCGAMLALSTLHENSSQLMILLPLFALGAGVGMFAPANSSSVLSAVSRDKYGVTAAFLNLMRNLGQTIGIIAATTVITLVMADRGVSAGLDALRHQGASADPALVSAFMSGRRIAYLVGAAVAGIGAILSLSRGPRAQEQARPVAVSVAHDPGGNPETPRRRK